MSASSCPLVSICVPNLNKRPFLPARMESLLAQTMTDWEMIVCDSYSDDGSWEYFQQYASDPRVRLHQVPKEGLYAGWNECLRRARGEYIYFATSDDTAEPRLLERLLAAMRRRDGLRVAVCKHRLIDEEGRDLDRPPRRVDAVLGEWTERECIRSGLTEFLLHACFGTIWVTMTAVLFHRSIMEETGPFRLDQKSRADEHWTLQASLLSDIAYVPEALASWRVYGGQATSSGLTREGARILLDSLDLILEQESSRFPESWRKLPDWREQIRHARHMAYREKLSIFRWGLKESPAEFLSGLAEAWRREPGFFAKQVLRGFSWPAELARDWQAYARDLIETFHSGWPPEPR